MSSDYSVEISEVKKRNYYLEFLETSNWQSSSQIQQRQAWFENLTIMNKESRLFRFEMLLKGLVALADVRNHPTGGKPYIDDVALNDKNHKSELLVWQQAFSYFLEQGMVFLGGDIENDDRVRRFVSDAGQMNENTIEEFLDTQEQPESPEQSLNHLLATLAQLQSLVAVMLRSDVVSASDYAMVGKLVHKAVMNSVYFNPLTLWEFKFQYDTIGNAMILETLSAIESNASRKITSAALMSLFRLRSCLNLIAGLNRNNIDFPEIFAILCAVHADAREFAGFLSQNASAWISTDFSHEFDCLQPNELLARYDDIDLQFSELKSLKELLESTGFQLALEVKKAFYMQIPGLDEYANAASDTDVLGGTIESLLSFLQSAIVLLVQEFNVNITGDELFDNYSSNPIHTRRFRRDIWMFRYILRAFAVKNMNTTHYGDKWVGKNTFTYVNTFVRYFKAVAYQLLRNSNYDRSDMLMALIYRLRDGDALEVQRSSHVVEECGAFYQYLKQMFEEVNARPELQGEPMDLDDARRTLTLLIGKSEVFTEPAV